MKLTPALLTLALLLSACTSDLEQNEKLKTVQRKVSQCESLLAETKYLEAYEATAEIVESQSALLAVDDLAVDQLRFCYATANVLKEVQSLSSEINRIITILDDSLGSDAAASPAYRLAAVQPFDAFLEDLVEPIVELLESNRTQLQAIVEKDRFWWHARQLPVVIADREVFDAHGVYDIGEVRVFLSMTELVLSGLRMFQSNNYGINLGPVISYVTLDETPLRHYDERPAAALLNMLSVLLATHPDFLGLKEGTGPDLVAQAGQELASSAANLLAAIDYMTKRRKGSQAMNIFEYRKEGVDDYLIVHIQFDREVVPGLELAKFDDLTIPLRSEVVHGLENIQASLAAAGGVRANLQADIFPLVSLVGVVLLNSGAVDELLNEVLEELDKPVADKLRAAIELDEMQETYLLAQLLTAVPTQAELDLGEFFANPVALRDLMPAWRQPAVAPSTLNEAMAAFTEATFVYEYECADPLKENTKRIVCDNPVDTAHFTTPITNDATYDNLGPYWSGSIEADGIKNPFAYIAFRDPTFNGALYLDVANIGSAALDNEVGMKVANQRTLNAAIASSASVLYNLFEQ
jgi:hypothetical protein